MNLLIIEPFDIGPFDIGPFDIGPFENWIFQKLDLLKIGPFKNWTFCSHSMFIVYNGTLFIQLINDKEFPVTGEKNSFISHVVKQLRIFIFILIKWENIFT